MVPTISLINHPLSKFSVFLWFLAGNFMHQIKDFGVFFGTQEKLIINITCSMEEYSARPLKIQSLLDQGAKATALLKSSLSTSLAICNLENKRVPVFTRRSQNRGLYMRQQNLKQPTSLCYVNPHNVHSTRWPCTYKIHLPGTAA